MAKFVRCIRTANRNQIPRYKLGSKTRHLNKPTDMKTKLSLLAFASILSGQLWLAQAAEPVNDWKPCPSNQAGKQYPQYNSEGRVKFRIVAPEAKSVGCTF